VAPTKKLNLVVATCIIPLSLSRLKLDQSLRSCFIEDAESALTASYGIPSFDDILRATIAASIFDSSNDRNRVDPGASVHGAPRSAHSATLFETANANPLLGKGGILISFVRLL
jgi:hypothetical protein